jgi:serine/threonine protein kinase
VPAAHLLGRDLPGGWRVVEVWSQDYSNSGGEFSIAYYVENRDGRRAFMKALNVSAALGAGEGRVVDRLKAFADAYVYERDLLRTCRNRRLLDFGELEVPEAGVLRQVPYLILELAEGDIRSHQSKLAEFDLAWVLRTMKHATQGIEQLHYAHTTHQDLRPSNILIQQSGREMKLGDLGRAERRGRPGPHRARSVPGAVSYAPPEQLYGAFNGSWELRCAGDVYHLGSLLVQLFLGHNLTSLLQQALSTQFRVQYWHGPFDEVLPYLRVAHSDVLEELHEAVVARAGRPSMTEEVVGAARELTDPDPALRGHPRDRAARTSSYAVRRYVSLFNRLAAQAEAVLFDGT